MYDGIDSIGSNIHTNWTFGPFLTLGFLYSFSWWSCFVSLRELL